MPGIHLPNDIMQAAKSFLMEFEEFDSNQALLAFIKSSQVDFLADYFPLGDPASHRAARVNAFIGYFKTKTLKDGRNALMLLLEDLPIPPEDSRFSARQVLLHNIAQSNPDSIIHLPLSPISENNISLPVEIAKIKKNIISLITDEQLDRIESKLDHHTELLQFLKADQEQILAQLTAIPAQESHYQMLFLHIQQNIAGFMDAMPAGSPQRIEWQQKQEEMTKLDAKSKLEFVIPIIPGILSYKTEVSTDFKGSVRKKLGQMWKDLKSGKAFKETYKPPQLDAPQ